jgi:hypothetical protein
VSLSTNHLEGGAASSRHSDEGAGWDCGVPGSFNALLPRRQKRLSWFNPAMLWRSRNDVLAKLSDPVPEVRHAWVEGLTDKDLTVDLTKLGRDFSFVLMGDTGEGDRSQYALIPPLLAHATDASFLLICSDVQYPIGDVNGYLNKFYQPYKGYRGSIYALPGNHDWYDNLTAFMYHVCDRDTPPKVAARGAKPGWWPPHRWLSGNFRRLLWKPPAKAEVPAVDAMAEIRTRPLQSVPQKSPYFVIDTEQLRLVCIDTGILGNLDEEQGRWLLRVSSDRRPKILLTGKPLLVDGECHPCEIIGSPDGVERVIDVVHNPDFRYIASIGGDIHNYQRYPAKIGNRTIQYVVSGGGGAFMHATHLIPKIDPDQIFGVTEDEFRCYPLRRDSLAAYSRIVQGMLGAVGRLLHIEMSPDEAAAFLSKKLGLTPLPTRPIQAPPQAPGGIRLRTRVFARGLLLFGGHKFHKWFSPFYDWDRPPFFKQFLRIDVSDGKADITCYGVTGCGGSAETDPPAQDHFTLRWW